MDEYSFNSKMLSIPKEIVDGINKLRTDQLETLLIARDYHCQKFAQLKPGMFFTKEAGFDVEQNEILSVDLDMMCFIYQDISVSGSQPKCSKMFEIPYFLYLNEAAMHSDQRFKFEPPTRKTVVITYFPSI